jgi:hypothetical protein
MLIVPTTTLDNNTIQPSTNHSNNQSFVQADNISLTVNETLHPEQLELIVAAENIDSLVKVS